MGSAANPKRLKQTEQTEQTELMRWVRFQAVSIPALSLLFHIPNGGKRSQGVAGQMWAMGVQAGVWDLLLPVARLTADGSIWAGLFLEMKASGESLSPEQKNFRRRVLAGDGQAEPIAYQFALCHSWIEAASALLSYLELPADLLEHRPAPSRSQSTGMSLGATVGMSLGATVRRERIEGALP